MVIDLKELKRLAQAATPGPWKGYTQTYGNLTVVGAGPTTLEIDVAVCDSRPLTKKQNAANGEFIAAANPSAVLALIERVERAERELSGVESVLNARGSTRAFHLMTVVERVDALAEKAERVSRLEALARKGLEAYHHGEACPFAFSTRPGSPAECENEGCREWAKALEDGK